MKSENIEGCVALYLMDHVSYERLSSENSAARASINNHIIFVLIYKILVIRYMPIYFKLVIYLQLFFANQIEKQVYQNGS